ncbi:MAG: 3-oxoacyl-ACP reductase [Rhizobiales bacterium PAR1]|nr:MAG: 3-oxoacyl-ACP reductase [Rhizobiales bacterium PAR1]
MDLDLKGKCALITGGSRGIGRATALALAKEGARIAIAARGPEQLARTAAEIAALGAEVITIPADFTEEGASTRAVETAISALGGLDILIANAGGSFGAREHAEATEADWEKTFRFNVVHAVSALQAARPALTASGQGSAIFIASISGRAPATRGAQYAAAKAALIQSARSLAWELGPERIRVNTVSPGSILFPGGGWERTRAERPEDFAAFEANDFPWQRLGTDTEVADAITFLASPKASWINGADIHVDGGQRRPSIR